MPFGKAFLCAACFLSLLLPQRTAMADFVKGAVELTNNTTHYRATDAGGLTTETRTEAFFQRYRLHYDAMLYPQLNLFAGINFEKTTFDNRDMKATYTNLMPRTALTLRTPLYSAGVSFDKREQETKTQGQSSTAVRTTESAFLGFTPLDLPTLDLRFSRMHTYDELRRSADVLQRTFSVSSAYRPVKNLDLSYMTSFNDRTDRLNISETEQRTESARAAYGNVFFDRRATFSTSYTINRQDTTVVRPGNDALRFQVFPFAGLAGISDPPAAGALAATPAVIDGNVTAGTGINIGQQPSFGGDTRLRNIGLDFGVEAEVKHVFVWVDRPLPDSIAVTFSWDIYVSSDNLTWSLHQHLNSAPFGAFDNRFEITVNDVKTRYIKVVTRPLSAAQPVPPGVDVSAIFVTELQAFFDRPASDVTRETEITTEVNDLNLRVNIERTERRTVYYDLYYQNVRRSGDFGSSSLFTNAIGANQRFSEAVTGTARISRELNDNVYGTQGRRSYTVYDGSLMAIWNSLPKLNHNAMLTGTRREGDDETSDSASASIMNTAQVYPGIDASLGATGSLLSRSDGTDSLTRLINFGASFVPHRSLTLTVHYVDMETRQTGPQGTTENFNWSRGAALSYNPVGTLYLQAGVTTYASNTQERETYHTLSGSWSVHQGGGALEIAFTYNESLTPEDASQTWMRVMSPSVRWRMNPRMYLESAYADIRTEGPIQTTESKSVTSSFKMYF
jgi:hypothetical protein